MSKIGDCIKVDSTIHKVISQLSVRFNRSEEDILNIINRPFNGARRVIKGEYIGLTEIDNKIKEEDTEIVLDNLSSRGLFYQRSRIMNKIVEANPRINYHNYDKISIIGFISLILKREKYEQFKNNRDKKGEFTVSEQTEETENIIQTEC